MISGPEYCREFAATLATEQECLDEIDTGYGGRAMHKALTARIDYIRVILLGESRQQYKADNLKEDKADNFSVFEGGILKENVI